ncbi:MAG: methionine gamma-lyase family protein [Clostridia bacterium]|nr:methionine gamma-lyase family protein [Clostridia bacterium]
MEEQLSLLTKEAEKELADIYAELDAVSMKNTEKILDAFRRNRVSEAIFAPTSGYGYDDRGRDTLDKIYAEVMGAEAAFVRHSIASGTHALAIGLYALLRPGDILYSVADKPYDTLDEVIGNIGEEGRGSLRDFGVSYMQSDFKDGKLNLEEIRENLIKHKNIKVVFIQRSKGYLNRPTLTIDEIGEVAKLVHEVSSAYVVVDNCYGEFVEDREPTDVGADMIIGSLIKNPGGGMAESGGYIAGTKKAVELAGYRFTAVGVGLEIGASLGQTKNMYRGLFYAPHTVAQAMKTAHFAAYIFEKLGYDCAPRYNERRSDIIQMIRFGAPEKLIAFCQGIQAGSPVDAFVSPEPWDMPGYTDPVIMAAGAFVGGSSIELSADGPIRPPYTAYLQGGLTYESGKIGILSAAKTLLKTQK